MFIILFMLGISSVLLPVEAVFNRDNCETNEWACDEGSCIGVTLKCNGVADCPDGSDETFPLCRKIDCSGFKCLYGGCVASNATCDGVQDCVDNSDELLYKCRNETTLQQCLGRLLYHDPQFRKKFRKCNLLLRTCKNGQVLTSFQKCNGKVDCDDESDETLETCATDQINCKNFRCKYGACIDESSVCNGVIDCADGSDELDGLCNGNKTNVWSCDDGTVINSTLKCNGAVDCPDESDESTNLCRSRNGRCILPVYPANGNYTVLEHPKASPGQELESALLIYYCSPGYDIDGPSPYVNCEKGSWEDKPLRCSAQCSLKMDRGTIYWCLSKGPLVHENSKECGELVADGATVRPECRDVNYHYTGGVLRNIHCDEGRWDTPVPVCTPQCGLVTSKGDPLVINGTTAIKGELPWHAAIYRKSNNTLGITNYAQICGGSLITNSIVISAAHCFWSNKATLLPARDFAVALGKLYRFWYSSLDVDAHKSDVQRIIISDHFRGVETSFQDDIALVVLASPVEYRPYLRPVCLDFDPRFELRQLAVGRTGKVAGWGLVSEDGSSSKVLQVAELPYVDINTCYGDSLTTFYRFITHDKFCAGKLNATTLCQGDSGGGLTFVSYEREEPRYYLRGVVSTKAQNDHLCNAHTFTTFTKVSKHKALIEDNWS